MRWNTVDWIAWVLIVVGALNWGAISFFRYDAVAGAFGAGSALTQWIYGLVGVAGLWQLFSILARPAERV